MPGQHPSRCGASLSSSSAAPDFLGVVRYLLHDEHYNVTINFVPRTFAQIETTQSLLLIVDFSYGEMAGGELLAELRQTAATCQIPVILVSTSTQLLMRAEVEEARWGGDRYLLKPFDLQDLLQVIRETIGPA